MSGLERAAAATTYWNFEPTPARRVWITVADGGGFPLAWWREQGIIGSTRAAVEVEYAGEIFYLDDTGGQGWDKVTVGRGSPRRGHRGLYAEPGLVIDR